MGLLRLLFSGCNPKTGIRGAGRWLMGQQLVNMSVRGLPQLISAAPAVETQPRATLQGSAQALVTLCNYSV